jgi:RNA polymerase sigma-70 factor (ECF subfamily)
MDILTQAFGGWGLSSCDARRQEFMIESMALEGDEGDLRDSSCRSGYYPTTRWTIIMNAKHDKPGAEEAWKYLVERYRRPIQAQIERQLKDDPENLTAEFMASVFVRDIIPQAERGRGRFRGFLATALHRFITSQLRRRYAQKRGGAEEPVPLESSDVHRGPALTAEPIGFFQEMDRAIAREVFTRAFEGVRESFLERGTAEEFELLIGRQAHLPIEQIARRLRISEEAVKVRRHRLRRVLREAFRKEVSDLVMPDEVEDEIRYLGSMVEPPAGPEVEKA